MSFSSRRRNYLLTPHRRDGLIEWMKSMLQHSFVLDALETTGADTFSHFEVLIDEHRRHQDMMTTSANSDSSSNSQPYHQASRLQQLVPTIGVFHTHLPLRAAFQIYNAKHRLTRRKHIQISFNEIRHILNLAQIMAMRREIPPALPAVSEKISTSLSLEDTDNDSTNYPSKTGPIQPPAMNGPRLITFDGDQTLYSDGANFDDNPQLASYMELLLCQGVKVAIVTAAGYEYHSEKYEFRLSGLLRHFAKQKLSPDQCRGFYLLGGECNYLFQLSHEDYRLRPVPEWGPGGWMSATQHLHDSPGNWSQDKITQLLTVVENKAKFVAEELNLKARIIRKGRAVGLVPLPGAEITRESLDEAVLCFQEELYAMNQGTGPGLPYCAFNGGSDAWVDVGNKRVGVQVLQSFLGIQSSETLHIGDQFLNTGNDFAARAVSPCIWIINPTETTYILKSILRLAGIPLLTTTATGYSPILEQRKPYNSSAPAASSSEHVDFGELERRAEAAKRMDIYTGELVQQN